MACDGDGVEAVVEGFATDPCVGCDNCKPRPAEEVNDG